MGGNCTLIDKSFLSNIIEKKIEVPIEKMKNKHKITDILQTIQAIPVAESHVKNPDEDYINAIIACHNGIAKDNKENNNKSIETTTAGKIREIINLINFTLDFAYVNLIEF